MEYQEELKKYKENLEQYNKDMQEYLENTEEVIIEEDEDSILWTKYKKELEDGTYELVYDDGANDYGDNVATMAKVVKRVPKEQEKVVIEEDEDSILWAKYEKELKDGTYQIEMIDDGTNDYGDNVATMARIVKSAREYKKPIKPVEPEQPTPEQSTQEQPEIELDSINNIISDKEKKLSDITRRRNVYQRRLEITKERYEELISETFTDADEEVKTVKEEMEHIKKLLEELEEEEKIVLNEIKEIVELDNEIKLLKEEAAKLEASIANFEKLLKDERENIDADGWEQVDKMQEALDIEKDKLKAVYEKIDVLEKKRIEMGLEPDTPLQESRQEEEKPEKIEGPEATEGPDELLIEEQKMINSVQAEFVDFRRRVIAQGPKLSKEDNDRFDEMVDLWSETVKGLVEKGENGIALTETDKITILNQMQLIKLAKEELEEIIKNTQEKQEDKKEVKKGRVARIVENATKGVKEFFGGIGNKIKQMIETRKTKKLSSGTKPITESELHEEINLRAEELMANGYDEKEAICKAEEQTKSKYGIETEKAKIEKDFQKKYKANLDENAQKRADAYSALYETGIKAYGTDGQIKTSTQIVLEAFQKGLDIDASLAEKYLMENENLQGDKCQEK